MWRGAVDDLPVEGMPASSLAVVPVVADAGGVRHGVGDVRLFQYTSEKVGHGAVCVHGNVFSAVGVPAARDCALLHVAFVFCKREVDCGIPTNDM